MIYTINGEQPFQVLAESFSVSPSQSGYDLYLSADGYNYSKFATVASNTTRQFTGMNEGNYYKLVGNTGVVKVNWMKDCGGGGGGAVAGVSSIDGQTGALTTKTINGNSILGSGDIVISGGSVDLSGYTTTAVTAELSAATSGIAIDLHSLSAYTETITNAKSYVLNLMTQEERLALYTELAAYWDSGYSISSGFPVEEYRFFYWGGDRNLSYYYFGGFAELELASFRDGVLSFASYETLALVGTKKTLRILIEIHSQGQIVNRTSEETPYSLPAASDSTLGGIKVGSGLTIDSGGTLSVSGGTSGPNVYVLNLMSQAERVALYTELMSYLDNNAPSSALPINNYVFYWYLPSNNPLGDSFRGYAQMYIAQLHPTDYGGAVFFTGVIGSRQYYQSDIYKLRFIITADGGTDSGILTIRNVEVNPNNFSWTGNLYYDADNSRFLRGENVLDPAGNADSFGSSDSIDAIILNGIVTDSGAPGRILPPVFKVYITSGGTTQMYTSPQIIGIDIAQITVDNQTYSRKYSFIYTKEDGSRFIIKMCLNGNQYATGFEYIAI